MRSFSILKCAVGFFAIFISITTKAQQPLNNIISSKKTTDGRYHFIKFDASKQNQSRNLSQPEQIKNVLGLGSKHSFVPNETINSNAGFKRDNQGADHVRYQQYFNGIKVEFADVTLHSKNGSVNLLTGEYFNIPEGLSTAATLSEKAAFSKALSFMEAKKYSWEDTSFRNSSLKSMPKGELIICKNFIGEANNSSASPQIELAYKFAVYATEPLRYDYIYVSAQTGNILLDNPIIKHTNGTGATRYSGSRTIATTQLSANNYALKDSGGNYNIATYNMSRGTSYTAATNFADDDNNWTAAEYNNSKYDNAALDTHWGAMITQDYWRTVHGRNSFDNKGSKINSYVHYANLYANAYWDGYEMTYGDGDSVTMGPLTSVDICGHEIGHAVCQYTTNLIYSNESGAINEGFSDIWGACIKRYADPSKNTWISGDEIYINGSGIRSLSNPKSHTQPDTYKGIYWYTGTGDNGGVHYNSGIMNYWFYLLTEGKLGTNDNGKAYSVSGIGITKAAQIAYRAESVYMFPAAAYADTRILTIQAAEDLFGAGSNEVIQTTAAWNAAGVYDALSKPDSVTATLVNNMVTVNWRFASSQSVDGFKIERALNGLNNFVPIGSVTTGIRTFTDISFTNNSLNQYRIRSFRGDSVYSDYSAVASVAVGNAPLIMTNGSYTTCGATFFDPGGSGNYSSGNYTMTLRPLTVGNKLQIAFSLFNTYDYLYIYNGPTTSYPLLGAYSGTTLPPLLRSTAAGGELTFVFNPVYSNYFPGWKAYVSCFKPVTAPSALVSSVDTLKAVRLSWRDNATDETNYAVERSDNDTLHFRSIVSLAASTTSYIDTTAPDNSYLYYRVRAYRDSIGSPYSNITSATIGNLFAMQNGSVTTCGVTFLDPGGNGNYGYGYYATTFRPATTGNKLQIAFNQFNVYPYDYLYIYNGPSTSSPLLGSYSGTALPPVIKSTAAGGELTFVFNPSYNNSYPGWSSYISCYKPVAAPGNLTTTKNDVKNVQLTWTDNATDETGYFVERSVSDSLHFLPLITLPANTSGYNDTAAADNGYIFYRVKAYRDSISSFYSNTASIVNGNQYVMQNGSYSTCGVTFLDPGGTGNYPAGNTTTTIRPAVAGNKLKIAFSQFSLNYDYLYIYDGPSASSPLLGIYYGTNIPPVLLSTAPGGELTFVFNTYNSGNPGWAAYISCYKPVGKPSGVKASVDAAQRVQLSWTDNADDETKYVIEKSVNTPSKYVFATQIPANTTQYTDSSAPANSLVFYRVRAYRDTLASFYSDTAIVEVGNAPYLMKDTTLVTCDKIFMDPGGVEPLPYPGYYYKTTTFKPAVSGNNIRVSFSKFGLSSNGTLSVLNGPSASSPLIGTYGVFYNTILPVFNSTAADGSLTFVYQENTSSYNDSGWVAQVSCYKPVTNPSGVKAAINASSLINLTWKDNANDETKYVVERSINSFSLFSPLAQLPANTREYTDSSAPANSLLYYRIKAYRDTLGSLYSDTASVAFGNAPFLMQDSTLITCDKVFMDSGGTGVIPQTNTPYNIQTTFKSAVAGNNVNVAFSKFRLYNGSLYVYNGPTSNSPLIGYYNSYYIIPSVFNGNGPDGSLTFVYKGNSYSDSGWVAQVSCYKPVTKPSGVKATTDTSKSIIVSWNDNADNETKYVLERSVNAYSIFTPIAQLPSNTTQYIDTAAPANNFFYYRVKGYHDTISSFYSDTAFIAFGNVPFFMKDSTLITCDKVFMDPGGADVIPQKNDGYYYTTTFKPSVAGNNIRAVFSKLKLNNSYLYVYNGSTASSPYIATYGGGYPNPSVINGNGPDGSLTFVYRGFQYSDSGWVAQIICYKPVARPSGIKAVEDNSQQIKLTWKDNSDDETRYVVERSVNAPSLFTPLAQLSPNSTQYTDSTPVANSLLYYRIRAYRDTLSSLPGDTAVVAFGNAPFLIKDSTLITCDKVFMDPGGTDVIPANYSTVRTTFKPGISGNSIKAVFSKMRPGNTPLYVYNGSSVNSPFLASTYTSTSFPLVYKATNTEGALTFSYQTSSYADSGWLGQISCYKPITPPGTLTADTATVKGVRLKWTDNANNEAAYLVERSVTDSLHFQSIASLPANTAAFTDTAAPANGFIYYRVAAYIDSSSFEYSNTVSIITGTPFIMQNTTITTCGIVFLDPGGTGNYNSGNYTATVKPGIPGNLVRVQFSQFNTGDYLYVYDGPSTSYRYLGSYYGTTLPPLLQSTAPGGELTFQFNPYNSNTYAGWTAYLSCYKPVLKPTGMKAAADTSLKINLTWTDNANDETKYVVERSVNAPSLFKVLKELPANTTQFTDTATPANSVVYYRVKAYRDTAGSAYSDTAFLSLGNAPFIMKDSVLITCDKIFMDPGGTDIIPNVISGNNITTTTFKPAVAGNNIRVTFSSLKFGAYLYVYNGASASSPLITTLSYYTGALPVFNSTAADGSLTFVYRQYAYGDSGWVAQVSCYKPVAKPTTMKAQLDTSQKVKLTWTDNADDETKYVVERSVNASTLYAAVAQLLANTTQYTDSSAPANSLLFYRVKAYRDTLGSFYSDTASIGFGNAPFLMRDSTVITCNKVFMDPAGADVIPGNSYYSTTTTFKPGTSGNNIQVAFSKLRINGTIYIYNGASVNSPQIGYLSSSSNPSSAFASTAADGSLTLRFYSSNFADSGWVAQVSCVKIVAKPSGVKAIQDSIKGVKVTWNDNANDETKYVVERSVNAPSQYTVIAQLPSNTTQFTDSAAPANSFIFYRVRAYRDSLYSFYSDTANISFGNSPYLMKDSTLITCSKVFLDAGGTDIIPTGSYYSVRTTFKPASGNKINVTFSKFRLSGYLYVYNGPTTSSPQIGSYSGNYTNTAPLVFNSTAPDGSLTFVYSGYSNSDSGWVAQVSCIKLVTRPSGVKAVADSSQRIKITWTDNADDETRYVVERSVNAPSKYSVIGDLPSNSIQFTDSSAPANSFLFYRVRAYRDTLPSPYSDTATVGADSAPFLMKDSTLITCNTVFLDPGGTDIIPQGINFYTRTTFKPGITGSNIKVAFSKLKFNGTLYIFDGSSTASPRIGTLDYYSTNPVSFQAASADGSLTFLFSSTSFNDYLDSGWVAQVSCFKPVAAPVNLLAVTDNQKNVNLSWTDNANDETTYSVERSFNDSLNFLPLISLPANTTSYTDTSAPVNSFIFYRVKAYRDSVASAYSNKVSVLNGTTFSMRSGTVKACGITFLDPGGAGDYGNNANYTTTFAPAESGKKTRVTFNAFSTESCCDYLNVYNGPNILSPLIGTYLGSSLPPVLQSTAPGGELTFRFITDGAVTGSGWNAAIDCIKTSDTLVSCSTDSNEINTITSNISGTNYQWQKYNGTAFVTMISDPNSTGTNTFALKLKNAGLTAFEKFRCLVNGNFSNEFVIIKGNRWTGNVSTAWTDPKNWSCGIVPDGNTDVLIESGMQRNPTVDSNGECRSLTILTGANLYVAPGYILNIRH